MELNGKGSLGMGVRARVRDVTRGVQGEGNLQGGRYEMQVDSHGVQGTGT